MYMRVIKEKRRLWSYCEMWNNSDRIFVGHVGSCVWTSTYKGPGC